MSKSSLAWLVVRILGLVSIAVALYHLYELILNVIEVVASSQQESLAGGTIRLANFRWDPLLGFVLFSSLSLYFLKFGLTIHNLLTNENGSSENS